MLDVRRRDGNAHMRLPVRPTGARYLCKPVEGRCIWRARKTHASHETSVQELRTRNTTFDKCTHTPRAGERASGSSADSSPKQWRPRTENFAQPLPPFSPRPRRPRPLKIISRFAAAVASPRCARRGVIGKSFPPRHSILVGTTSKSMASSTPPEPMRAAWGLA